MPGIRRLVLGALVVLAILATNVFGAMASPSPDRNGCVNGSVTAHAHGLSKHCPPLP
jgi:hypothetical protein